MAETPQDPLFRVTDLSFSYMLGEQTVQALRGIDLVLPRERLICFSGPSGSGKTTLLSVLGLIEPVQQGEVVFKGRDVGSLEEHEKNSLRRYHIGFIFQQFHLIPVLTAYENVELFLSRQGLPKEERHERVMEALENVRILEQRDKRPWEMSGGQRQRVAVARAIAKRPDVIIADEPTASLDQKTGRQLMEIFSELHARYHISVLCASHDPMVMEHAERRVVISDGQVVEMTEQEVR